MKDIAATLAERAQTHGDYTDHARVTQAIKRVMVDSPNWSALADHQMETLEMVAHKIGRILSGNPDAHDHWHDIAGYATLSAQRGDDPIAQDPTGGAS